MSTQYRRETVHSTKYAVSRVHFAQPTFECAILIRLPSVRCASPSLKIEQLVSNSPESSLLDRVLRTRYWLTSHRWRRTCLPCGERLRFRSERPCPCTAPACGR